MSNTVAHSFISKGIAMNKTLRILTLLTGYIIISACSNFSNNKANTNTQWDFDHNVQFTQTKLANNTYQLEIIPNGKVNFERLATFLLRKSYSLCQQYHYQLEIIQGIESFDDRFAMPNYVFPSLIAKVRC